MQQHFHITEGGVIVFLSVTQEEQQKLNMSLQIYVLYSIANIYDNDSEFF